MTKERKKGRLEEAGLRYTTACESSNYPRERASENAIKSGARLLGIYGKGDARGRKSMRKKHKKSENIFLKYLTKYAEK